jgi:site-specific recombinase XerD
MSNEHNRGRKLPPETLTGGEVCALLGECNAHASTGVRNRALLTVLYRGMLRTSEALDLMPKDFDVKAGTLRVLHGKGDKHRLVGLDETACAIVARWFDRRERHDLNGRHRLFCTLGGSRLNSSYVRTLMKRLGHAAGIEKRVHAHGLRHTGAAEMLAEGFDIGVISRQLGHRSIATTAKYLDHISPQRVIDAARSRKWEGQMT